MTLRIKELAPGTGSGSIRRFACRNGASDAKRRRRHHGSAIVKTKTLRMLVPGTIENYASHGAARDRGRARCFACGFHHQDPGAQVRSVHVELLPLYSAIACAVRRCRAQRIFAARWAELRLAGDHFPPRPPLRPISRKNSLESLLMAKTGSPRWCGPFRGPR
jgi:hypothetical protein